MQKASRTCEREALLGKCVTPWVKYHQKLLQAKHHTKVNLGHHKDQEAKCVGGNLAHELSVLALKVKSCAANGNVLRADHLASGDAKGVGGNEPQLVDAECLCGTQLHVAKENLGGGTGAGNKGAKSAAAGASQVNDGASQLEKGAKSAAAAASP